MRLHVSWSALLAGLLGIAAALLVGCASSAGKLIPVADAGPLQSDFETVAQAAEAGNGECSATEAAIARTEQDFNTLPATVDAGLRQTLRQGIDNLRSHALALCAQPLAQTTATSTTPKTTTTSTAPSTTTTTTSTATTPTSTSPTTTTPTTTATTPGPGGGTPAPGVGEGTPGAGGGTGAGEGPAAGGAGAEPGAGAGGGAAGQEAGK